MQNPEGFKMNYSKDKEVLEVLEYSQQRLFRIESLSRVLKLASSTSYTIQMEDEDIACVSDIIREISEELGNKIAELL